MEHEAHTVVDQPVSMVYNQWTQFETFPEFMEGVTRVVQLDDASTRWDVEVGGVERSFVADIVEQTPDDHIRWETRTTPVQQGAVRFAPRGDSTEVALWMNFEPQDWVEKAGDGLGFVQRRVEGDLKRFKEFIERRGSETGAWRGSVDEAATDEAGLDGASGLPPQSS
jgi:uncharacterized membrane protein